MDNLDKPIYLHFDVSAYLRSRIEHTRTVEQMLRDSGDWNEGTQRVHQRSVDAAEHELKVWEEAPKPIKRGIILNYLSFVRVLKSIPEDQADPTPKESLYVGDDLE